jgi:hypothetical protein
VIVVVVRVGWTTSRPVVPDEHVSWIVLEAASEVEATLVAAQWAASRERVEWVGHKQVTRYVEMPTSARVVEVLEL